ncbi:hypothetical protein OHB26_21520 [Nocardia sp. NBC_01503]|uniref:WXG100-like domain-containing protein n=1 Tax=Nocardia sp. NBC_01503 TaxID=2975997 RepID=UPI002E7BC4DC|nr:hypothetical protein [Nocardia sp. NBC_01503]WTL29566.1 hypothetical protein OHB26_21520 [Nocardia sp. NBC_01503]
MSLEWPPDLRFLTYIVGQAWPDGDEDRMFAMAQGWLDAATDLEAQVIPLVRAGEALALTGYESGTGRTAIATELGKLSTGDNSIERLAKDFRETGASTRHAATTIEETKLMIILSATMLAAQIAGAWLWPPTAPAVEAAAIGATRAAVYRIGNRALAALAEIPHIGEYLAGAFRYLPRLADEPGRISRLVAQPATALASRATPRLTQMLVDAGFRETTALTLAELPADTVKFLIEKAVNNTIWAGGLDIMVQEIQIGKGHRDGLDGKEIGMSIAASTGGWYAGALVATNLGKFGGKLLTGWGKDPTAGVWGAGLGVLSGTVPTMVSTLVGGGIAELFTGTFDPRIGLIGAVSSNSLIGMQRGYIGMLGREPAATRFDEPALPTSRAALEHTPEPVSAPRSAPLPGEEHIPAGEQPNPGGRAAAARTDAPAEPIKSSSQLLEEIRQRDAPGYRGARADDRSAARSGENPAESGGSNDARAARNAHTNEQRALVRDLTTTRREVLNAELEHVRARARAAATPTPEAHTAVTRAQQRLDTAVAADAATRTNIQAGLAADNAGAGGNAGHSTGGDEAPAHPGPVPRHRDDAERATAGGSSADDTARRDADAATGNELGTPSGEPAPHASDDTVPHPGDEPAQRNGVQHTDDGTAQHSGDEPVSHADSDTGHAGGQPVAHRNDEPAHGGRDEQVGGISQVAEGPKVTAVRNKLAAADDRLAELRTATGDSARAYTRADRRGLSALNEHRAAEREALAAAKATRDATKAELVTARADHDGAPAEQRAAARARVTDLEQTLRTHERDVADQTARLALTDHELGMTRGNLEKAVAQQDRAMAAAENALTELDDANRAAAADRERPHSEPGRSPAPGDHTSEAGEHPRAPHPDAWERLQGEIRQHRAELDRMRVERDDLLLRSGIAESRLRAQLAELDNSIRSERTLLDGGYMSGKPKPRKRPLEHGMPDQFTALRPPNHDFWRTGGIDEQPKPNPQPVPPGHHPHRPRPPHHGHPPHRPHP